MCVPAAALPTLLAATLGWRLAAAAPPADGPTSPRPESMVGANVARAAPAGSAARKVADFHAAWLNEAAIEARGLASLEPLLDRIEKVSDKALAENIADLSGLVAAFDAYRKTLGGRAADTEFVRRQDREFFIAYAQTQRRKISDAALRAQAATSDHAPEETRAATVRNLDAWYDAFDVRPGQRLYLEPSARVRVW